MTEMTTNVAFRQGGDPAPVSRGGPVLKTFVGRFTFSASVAAGGDTIPTPNVGANATLRAVQIAPVSDGDSFFSWDGSTSTPKIQSYDQADGTASNIGGEETGDLSAKDPVTVILTYEE